MNVPKFSIVIATYNAANYLEGAIQSIDSQNYRDYELIIIDGGSNDNTVDIIKRHSDKIKFWISEPDNGIYDAWNKAVKISSGYWIMFLGSDDRLRSGALESYSTFLENVIAGDLEYISSRIQMIDRKGNAVRIKGWAWEWPRFLTDMTVAHPGSLHSRSLFARYGLYNTKYKIVGDYELLLRPKSKLKSAYHDYITVDMLEGGTSDTIKGILEALKASIRTGGISPIHAYTSYGVVIIKFLVKGAFRRLGLNVYLKK